MTNYTHILVAVDFSASADQVVAKACDIAKHDNARLSLLHVVEYLPPIESIGEPFITSNWEIDEGVLLENSELAVLLGTPKHEISQFVKDNKCDLVVMGSHGRHGINLLLGSTANAVLHAMPCDILTIKIEK